MEFQLLKPDEIQKLLELRTNLKETNQWIGEAIELEETGPDERRRQKKCYLLVTEICLYNVNKDGLHNGKAKDIFSFFDLNDINLDDKDNVLTVCFKGKNYMFQLVNAATLLANILIQVRKLSWNMTPGQITSLRHFMSNKYYKETQRVEKRPPNLLMMRYLASCLSKETKPNPYIIETFNKYDEDPRTVLKLENCEVENPNSPMFVLTLEPYLESITLEKYSPNSFSTSFNYLFSHQNKLSSVVLHKFETAEFKGLFSKKSPFNNVRTLRISACSTSFVSSFLEAIKGLTFGIKALILSDIKFDNQTSILFTQSLQSSTFLSSLNSLAFVGCQCVGTSFYDLAVQSIRQFARLDNLTIENCYVDINDILLEIEKANIQIQNISLRKNVGTSTVGLESSLLPNSTLSLNVGDSEWTEEAFISFITAICRRLRRLPLTLVIDKCRIDSTWSDVFERFPNESLLPVVTELNISYNIFDPKALEGFLSFIETQSPALSQYKLKLSHLNISHCFKEEDSVDCLETLIEFISKRDLWGLEICGCKPSPNLINISDLHTLNIGDSDFDRMDIDIFLKFVHESPTITELGIDNIKFPDVKTMMQFYGEVLTLPKLLAFAPLTYLYNQYKEFNETKKFKEFLNKKRIFSNYRNRLALYLALSEDFSTHVASPIKFFEEDESVAEGKLRSDILQETILNKSVPSLITLATINTVDTSVDPVASMVSEYVATSGKYGIIPPTAPPPIPCSEAFKIPSIFSTMTTSNEIYDDTNNSIDFNTHLNENIKLSKELMSKVKLNFLASYGKNMKTEDGKPTKIFNFVQRYEELKEKWSDKTDFFSFVPLDVPLQKNISSIFSLKHLKASSDNNLNIDDNSDEDSSSISTSSYNIDVIERIIMSTDDSDAKMSSDSSGVFIESSPLDPNRQLSINEDNENDNEGKVKKHEQHHKHKQRKSSSEAFSNSENSNLSQDASLSKLIPNEKLEENNSPSSKQMSSKSQSPSPDTKKHKSTDADMKEKKKKDKREKKDKKGKKERKGTEEKKEDENKKDKAQNDDNKDIEDKKVKKDKKSKKEGEDKQSKKEGEDKNDKKEGEDKKSKKEGENKQSKKEGKDKQSKKEGKDKKSKKEGEDKKSKKEGKDKQSKKEGEDKNDKKEGKDKNDKKEEEDKKEIEDKIDKNEKEANKEIEDITKKKDIKDKEDKKSEEVKRDRHDKKKERKGTEENKVKTSKKQKGDKKDKKTKKDK